MTLDEAIKYAENIAEENQRVVDTGIVFNDVTIDMLCCDDTEVIEERLANYQRCAEDHRQLAEWLRDYKRLKEQEPCDHYTEGYFKGYDDGQKGKLEQEPCEDWYDIPSGEMTLEQARQAVKELRKRVENIEKQMKEDEEEQLKKLKAEIEKLKAELDYAKFRCTFVEM